MSKLVVLTIIENLSVPVASTLLPVYWLFKTISCPSDILACNLVFSKLPYCALSILSSSRPISDKSSDKLNEPSKPVSL